jgi:hypothetical protein
LKFSTSFSFKDKDIDRRNEKVAAKKESIRRAATNLDFQIATLQDAVVDCSNSANIRTNGVLAN